MPEIEEHRPHRHRRRRSSRRKSSAKNKTRFGLVDAFLLLWSAASLIGFYYLIDKVESAPVWQITALALSALVGLVLFFRMALRTKK